MSLFTSIRRGHHKKLESLIKTGIDINQTDTIGNTGVATAVYYQRYRCINILVINGADVNIPNHSGTSPLMEAATFSNPHCVNILLRSGANVNQIDSNGCSALMWAVSNHCKQSVTLLLDAGAIVNIYNCFNTSPLLEAALHGNIHFMYRLLQSGACVNQDFIIAAKYGSFKCLKYLLKIGADINTSDSCGNSALLSTVRCGYWQSVHLLIKKGAQVDQCNMFGETPLIVAAKMGFTRIAKELIRSNADINKMDSTKKTPLEWASCRNKCDMVKLLIQKGANLNSAREDDLSPLLCDVNNGCIKCTQFLLERKRDIPDERGLIRFHRCGIVKMLTSFEANVQHSGSVNTLPMVVQAHAKCRECIETLTRHGADIQNKANIENVTISTRNVSHTVMKSTQTIVMKEKVDCVDRCVSKLNDYETQLRLEKYHITKDEQEEVEKGICFSLIVFEMDYYLNGLLSGKKIDIIINYCYI